jgi:hypothetical protein
MQDYIPVYQKQVKTNLETKNELACSGNVEAVW